MLNLIKAFKILTFYLLAQVFLGSFSLRVSAQTVDLADFVVGPVGHSHVLSTGETITYKAEGGGIRMYKNSNYEQFIIQASGIYRREDTSWAPKPGFVDAVCTDGPNSGQKAIYTIHTNAGPFAAGTELAPNDAAKWAPRSASVGEIWVDNFSVIPISAVTDLSTSRIACTADFNPGVGIQTTKIQFTDFYNTGEFEFCTGLKNPSPLAVLTILEGPGSGDTFYYMQGYGLAGFEAPGFQAGLSGAGGEDSACGSTPQTGSSTTVTIRGQVYTNLPVRTETNSLKYGAFLGKVKVTAYTGNPVGDDPTEVLNLETCQNEGIFMGQSMVAQNEAPYNGAICNSAAGCPNVVTTGDDGYFEINLKKNYSCREDKNVFLVFYGGQGSDDDKVLDIWLVSTKRSYEPMFVGVNAVGRETKIGNKKIYEIETDASDPPRKLKYIDRTNFLTCVAPNPLEPFFADLYAKLTTGRNGETVFRGIKFKDSRGPDARSAPIGDEDITGPNGTPDGVIDKLSKAEMDGRVGSLGQTLNKDGATMARCSIIGCPKGNSQPNSDPGSNFQYDQLPSCDEYLCSNSSIADSSNNPTCSSKRYGPGVLLATPNSVNDASFSTQGTLFLRFCADPDLKERLMHQSVCKQGGDELNIFQIQSPWYKSPEVAACTGYSANCVPGQPNCYKLSSQYFPYDLNMVGLEVPSINQEEVEAVNDSYKSNTRAVDFVEGNDDAILGRGGTVTVSTFASDAHFAPQPGGVLSPQAVLATENTTTFVLDGKTYEVPPPDALMQGPKTVATDAVSQDTLLKKRYEFSPKANSPIRVGRVQSLCLKSKLDMDAANPLNLLFSILGTAAEKFHPFTSGYSHVTGNNVDANGNGKFFGVSITDLIASIVNWFSSFLVAWDATARSQPDDFFFNADANCTLTEALWTTDATKDCPADSERKGITNGFCSCNPPGTLVSSATEGQKCIGPNGTDWWTVKTEKKMDYRCDAGTDTNLVGGTRLSMGKQGPTQLYNMSSMVLGPVDPTIAPNSACLFDTTVNNDPTKGSGLGDTVKCGLDTTNISQQYIYSALQDPRQTTNHSYVFSRPKLLKRARVPVIPTEVGNCGLGFTEAWPKFGIPELPEYAVSVIERAAYNFNVPAAALLAAMYAEGSFNEGKYPWNNEELIMMGSIEGESLLPYGEEECDPNETSGVGVFAVNLVTWNDMINGSNPKAKNALQKDFPGRIPSRCNFLDGAYVAAARIQEAANGHYAEDTFFDNADKKGVIRCPQLPGQRSFICDQCFGVKYSTVPAASCNNWTYENTAAMSRGFAGYCHDDVGSGGEPTEPPMCIPGAGQTTEATCRETYSKCASGNCSSYVSNMFYILEKYRRGNMGQ